MPERLTIASDMTIPVAAPSRGRGGNDIQLRCWRVDCLGEEIATCGKKALDEHVHIFANLMSLQSHPARSTNCLWTRVMESYRHYQAQR